MSGREFLKWLNNQPQLKVIPKEAFNTIGGACLEIVHKTTGSFAYFSGPFGDKPVPNRDIKDICIQLGIGFPPGLSI